VARWLPPTVGERAAARESIAGAAQCESANV
jgi:hypothetical protein